MSSPSRRLVNRVFGKPTLHTGGSGIASWGKATALGQFQKGHSGILAHLYGGAQSGDDWAACYIGVDEILLSDYGVVTSGTYRPTQWTWYQTNAETMGLGIVIWIHDPKDPDKRAEITQLANVAGLDKGAGWNSHELVYTTDQFFFYGEGTTGTALTAGPANLYGLDDFQADILFKHWTIYRISLDWGWDASGTYESAWLSEVKLDGNIIMLDPSFVEFDIKTGIGNGRGICDAAGTANQITTTTTPCKVIVFTAETNNTGAVVLGGSTTVDETIGTRSGTPLFAGDSMTMEIDDISKVYIDANVTGDGCTFTYFW